MIPVVTPEEMAGVDRAAPEPVELLVERAGFAVAHRARRLLGRAYGARVVVVAGAGNNGADGRVAARWLTGWGAAVRVEDARRLAAGARLPRSDLVIDAAYGTGLSRPYDPPDPRGAPVLAVDIPSGLSGLTGCGEALSAAATVTFGAYKPGLLIGRGPDLTGEVDLAPLGLSSLAGDAARAWVVEDRDLEMLPERGRAAHKWQTAVLVVGGSPAMAGAPLMVASGAMRSGAGYALVAVPGGGGLPPGEWVGVELPARGWAEQAANASKRVKALAVGPGLGEKGREPVADLLASTSVPAVVDADALTALGSLEAAAGLVRARGAPLVLTPHEGEYERIAGGPPGDDRLDAVRDAARRSGSVVLLKGAPTIVAEPEGRVLLAVSGRPRLATAGTGDTLTGIITAFLARGLPPLEAAALGAHCHGRAAAAGRREGLMASDLPDLVSAFLSDTLHRSDGALPLPIASGSPPVAGRPELA